MPAEGTHVTDPNGDCGISRRDSRGYSTFTCAVKLQPSIAQMMSGCGWPLLTLSGDAAVVAGCPLFGVKRTSGSQVAMSKSDPKGDHRCYRASTYLRILC